MKKLINTFAITVSLIVLMSFQSVDGLVYLEIESRKLHNGKVVTHNSELLLNIDNGEMIIHYTQPQEMYIFSNKLGEMKLYYPKRNEVLRQQNMMFSSEGEAMYHFFNNQGQDLGLTESGFFIDKSELEDQYLVTDWNSPPELASQISKAKLVQEDYLPIYLAYFDAEEKVKQKLYLSEWSFESIAVYPKRMTQIDFLSNNDSIISKKIYKNLKLGKAASESFAFISIPEDAKLIKTEK